MQNTWKVIKQAMNLVNNNSDVTKINHENKKMEDPKEIANIFNDYFSLIGNNLAKTIPPTNTNFKDFLDNQNPNSIFFLPTNKQEITKIVSDLKN